MTTEFWYLLVTTVLTGVLWIPVVIGYAPTRGPLKPSGRKVAPTSPLPSWVNRANRAHVNAVENLATFAPVVLIAHAAGVSTSIPVRAAAVHFYARAAHAVVHITGFGFSRARTVLSTIAWVAFLAFAIELPRKSI